MTAQQAIEKANAFKQGNTVTDEKKLEWLTEIDKMVYEEVIKEHIQPLTSRWWSLVDGVWVFAPAPEYTQENCDDVLIAEEPYNEFYVYWLMAKTDLFSQDLNRYNNDYALFESAYRQYKNKYHKSHRTIPQPQIKVGTFK